MVLTVFIRKFISLESTFYLLFKEQFCHKYLNKFLQIMYIEKNIYVQICIFHFSFQNL